jgi:hypothetical protein
MAAWPSEVSAFEAFLTQQGLSRTAREVSGSFDNRFVEYSDGRLAVRVVCEKSVWHVEVSDVAARPADWYDAAVLRDLLGGRGKDVLSLSSQIAIVESNWQGIRSQFSARQRDGSHVRLAQLRKERVKRRFPGLRGPGVSP